MLYRPSHVWGVILVVPFVGNVLAPLAGVYSSGYSILAGGIVLAIMTFPTIIHVTLEVFASVPHSLRDASLSLGATRWETTRHVVLRKGAQGILAASVLGFSRAFGETMAVLMVAGCALQIAPRSIFDPAYPLPAHRPSYSSARLVAGGADEVFERYFRNYDAVGYLARGEAETGEP